MKKSSRTVLGIILAGIIVLGLPVPRAEAGAEKGLRLAVRVFRVPREQSFDALFLDNKGRPVPFQASGDVTSAFPRATVFFETDLAANASESAIAAAILDKVSFGTAGMAARRIRVDELKAFELELGPGRPAAQGRFEESRGEGRTSTYEVRAECLSAGKDGVLVRLRFDAGWAATGGSLGAGMSEAVISAAFEVPGQRLMLIGGIASGTVYWIAVTIRGE